MAEQRQRFVDKRTFLVSLVIFVRKSGAAAGTDRSAAKRQSPGCVPGFMGIASPPARNGNNRERFPVNPQPVPGTP
jgi:hypothetical protein